MTLLSTIKNILHLCRFLPYIGTPLNYMYMGTYPTFGKPTMPTFKFVPTRPINTTFSSEAAPFFFGGILGKLHQEK